MAHSRLAGPLGTRGARIARPEPPPGPLGVDAGECNADSPGPLGNNDWAEFAAGGRMGPRTAELSAVTCACDRDLRLRELRRLYPRQSRTVCEAFLPFLNATFKAYKIRSCLRKAHFLAQVAHESGELQFTREQVSNRVAQANYAGYQGRGLIQLTFENNYRRYGIHAGHDFLREHKTDLELPKWASDSAGWFWTAGSGENLNALADDNDLLAITAQINGGFNGFDDRRTHLKLAFKVLKVPECKSARSGAHPYRPFAQSRCYDDLVHAFAWGAWNDPAARKTGVSPQLPAERRSGYTRYLELRAKSARPPSAHEHHYGFSVAEMDRLAAAGSR